MVPLSQSERAALATLLAETGPDAPTLCAGWTTRDLAAHVVLRERRPDAALGIALPPLRRRTERVQDALAARPFGEVVDQVGAGPPAWSPFGWRVVDPLVNGTEFFVHHEDVRRAQPGWEPRALPREAEAQLWAALGRTARLVLRGARTPVRLVAPGFGSRGVGGAGDGVTLTGPPSELILYCFGRQEAARVDAEGDPDAVAALGRAKLGA